MWKIVGRQSHYTSLDADKFGVSEAAEFAPVPEVLAKLRVRVDGNSVVETQTYALMKMSIRAVRPNAVHFPTVRVPGLVIASMSDIETTVDLR